MPIHMGIMCTICRKVHFIGTSSGIQVSRKRNGMYRFVCTPECRADREVRKEEMRPYRVAENVFRGGWAKEGEYELVRTQKQLETPEGR
jgi:hypothetical protein